MRWILLSFSFFVFNFFYKDNVSHGTLLTETYQMPIRKRNFSVKGMNIYYGNLHSHTKYSDGKESPVDMLRWARDYVHYDFYCISDHAEMLSETEWADIGNQVEKFNQTGKFIALRGFEWSGSEGHVNVFNTNNFTHSGKTKDLRSLYAWLCRQKEAIAQFNHTGWMGATHNELQFDSAASGYMLLFETGNENYGNNSGIYTGWYDSCLNKGWKVAPVNNMDNHFAGANSHVTAVVAPELSRHELFSALASRRVYSTDDPDIKIAFTCMNEWMGSEIHATGSVSLEVQIEDDEEICKAELISNNGKILAETYPQTNQVKWNPVIKIDGKAFVYLKVTSLNTNDNDIQQQVAITAPFFFNY